MIKSFLSDNYPQIIKSYITIKNIIYVLVSIFLTYSIWLYISLPELEYLANENPKKTALMEMRIERAKAAGKKFKIRQQWVSFSQIPDLLKKTVRITEDSDFYGHEGIDWTEIKESLKKNWETGEYARGGSTISQQVSKNLYLSIDKSIFRKLKELFITYRLEGALNKNRIFHIYLNIIEFGNGIFGVQAASQYYFKKNVSELNLSEIVRLTAIIPKPLKERANGNSRWLKWKARWILGKLKLYKYISEEEYNSAIIEFQK